MEERKNPIFETKKTILVVDDEEINRSILSAILEEDFHVLEASDGKEALDILRKGEHKIDLVLLDIFMPMDGREVLRIRQKDLDLKKIPFFVCTSDKNIEEECFHLGANDFVKKPYENADIVVARIRRMIELYEDRSILKDVERDKLTNLLNREFFKKFSQQFDALFPEIDKDMLSISIDRFGLIHELYGNELSNKILLAIADQLLEFLSERKGLAGKDAESAFMVYCEHQEDYASLSKKLNEAIHHIASDINVSLRIGVYPLIRADLDKDIAIERAKSTADVLMNDYSKSIAIYNEEKQATALHMEELIDVFPQALQEEQFKLFFQPKYHIQGDKAVFASAEVLIRWISPKFGFISPGEFIPVFEENGLIGKLDAYILEKSAVYMRRWKEKYGLDIPLSVNLSRVDIYRPNIVEEIIKYVDSNNVPRKNYYVEITESAFVEDSKTVIPVIHKIRDSGFKIEIDDFGSGYSSFGALVDLPFDVLKIDMQFIRGLDANPKVKVIVKMIINLAKVLNALTVAEGVENESQYRFLKENGCDVIQGYYLSKPLSLTDFEALIERDLINHGC